MSEPQQDKRVSVPELLDSVRRLGREDPEGLRRLVDEICSDTYLGLARDAMDLAKKLGYRDAELLDAVDSCGLVRTFGFLRLEAKRRGAEETPGRVM